MDWNDDSFGYDARGFPNRNRQSPKSFHRGGRFQRNSFDRFSHTDRSDNGSGSFGGPSWRRERGGKDSRYDNRRGRYSSDVKSRLGPVNSSEMESMESRPKRGRGRHPPGLRGKAIGLWYAHQSSGGMDKKSVPVLSMGQFEASAINKAIDNLKENPEGFHCEPSTTKKRNTDESRVNDLSGSRFDSSATEKMNTDESRVGDLSGSLSEPSSTEKMNTDESRVGDLSGSLSESSSTEKMNTDGSKVADLSGSLSEPSATEKMNTDGSKVGDLSGDDIADEQQQLEDLKQEQIDCLDNPMPFDEANARREDQCSDVAQVLSRIDDSSFKNAYQANIEGNKLRDRGVSGLLENYKEGLKKDPALDETLYVENNRRNGNLRFHEMLKIRKRLPTYKKKSEILKLINDNQVIVLSGETGCGKTTQVPQFIMEDLIRKKSGSTCRIVCTQPRRISAITIAERVAEELGEKLGTSVGYQIRLEARLPRSRGSVLFCTTGIVLQWLQSDPLLSEISHLVLDEIHERDALSDFLLCIAKDLINLRPDLKVILMSATLNAEQFSKYFGDCPMIFIPGFTYKVQEYFLEDVLEMTGYKYEAQKERQFLCQRNYENKEAQEFEDYILPYLRTMEGFGTCPPSVMYELRKKCSEKLDLDLILTLLMYIAEQPPGAVLVFVPGWEQISALNRMIQEEPCLSSRHFLVIPLHSMMPTVNQRQVFDAPPDGMRKIVIATNIAETSITINDIVYVIDGGYIKMKKYDEVSNTSTLKPEFVSLANAKQRKGRAGRVQEGICYHLYTKAREMRFDEYPLPEIKRTRLEEVILQVKILRLGSCKTFLRKIMDPPEESIIDTSIKMLETINALDVDENLTPLGFHLARLPMDPLTGKMILMGCIFSCLGPALTVAASLSFKDPFVMSLGQEKVLDNARRIHSRGTNSDHLMLVNVFKDWQAAGGGNARQFMRDNFLSYSVLTQLKRYRVQFMQHLRANKFVTTDNPDAKEVNLNSSNMEMVKAVITAGLYPNVARIVKKTMGVNHGKLRCINILGKRVEFHPKSVNAKERLFRGDWLVFWEKIKSSKVFLYDTTEISNYPLLLFGKKVKYDPTERIIMVDEFVKIECDKDVAEVIKKLRKELNELLEYKISHPGITNWDDNSKESKLLSLIVEVISNEKPYVDHRSHFKRYQ